MLASIDTAASAPPRYEETTACGQVSGLTPAEQMLVLMVFSEMTRTDAAETSIEVSSEQLEQLREAVRKAMEAAHDAQEDAGFWGMLSDVLKGDVATLAELVAIAAAAVVTGGAAAAVLAAIAIGATLASKYAEQLGIPEGVAIGLGITAGLAMVAMGQVGGGLSQLSSLQQAAQTTKLIAGGTAAAATAGGGYAHGRSKDYEGDALAQQADERGFESAQVLASSDIDVNLDYLRRSLDRQLWAAKTSSEMLQSEHGSTQLVLQNYAGAA